MECVLILVVSRRAVDDEVTDVGWSKWPSSTSGSTGEAELC